MLNEQDKRKLLTYLKRHHMPHQQGWHNFSRNLDLPKTITIDIINEHKLKSLMRFINSLNQDKTPQTKVTLRPAAGGKKIHADSDYSESFSFSPCAEADVIVRLTGKEFQHVRVSQKKQEVTAGAGVQVGYLDKLLYEKHKLVLPTSSLFGYPTAVGLAANAGHGTGKDQPSFAGLIRSITLCTPNGKIKTIDADYDDFDAIQAAHLGLFGIVLRQTMRCIPAQKLHCKMDATNVTLLLLQVKNGLLEKSNYLSVMYVPTYRKGNKRHSIYGKPFTKDKNVLILQWDPVPLEVDDMNNFPALREIGQDLSIDLEQALRVPEILEAYPKMIPHYMRHLVTRISVGEDREAIGPWHEMMHYQTAFPWKIDDADYLFEVGEEGVELVKAMVHLVYTLTEFSNQGLYPVTYAVYFRIFQGTNGGLSTSAHTPGSLVCGLDIVSNPDVPGYQEFKRDMQAFFINELNAKPHWGKSVPLNVDYEALYGEGFERFKTALYAWHERCGVPVEQSPLVTPYFAEILKIPGFEHSRLPAVSFSQGSKRPGERKEPLPENEQFKHLAGESTYGTRFFGGIVRANSQSEARKRRERYKVEQTAVRKISQ